MPVLFLITYWHELECPWIQLFTQTRQDKIDVSQVQLMMVDVAVLISTSSDPSVLFSWFEHDYPYSYYQTVLTLSQIWNMLQKAVLRRCPNGLATLLQWKRAGGSKLPASSTLTLHISLSAGITNTHSHTHARKSFGLNTDHNHCKSSICNAHLILRSKKRKDI